jgi:rod shape determining protein RodA
MRLSNSPLQKQQSFAQRWHIDVPLFSILLIITVLGLGVLYSGSEESMLTIKRQVVFFFIAYVGCFFIAQINMGLLYKVAPWAYLFGVILLLLVPLIGVEAKGARRWISLPGFRFQPSEIMKLVLPITVAWYFSSRSLPPRFSHVCTALAIIGLPSFLILKQPDLGTALLVGSSGGFVLLLAGLSWRYIAVSVGLMAISGQAVWLYVLEEYQKRRILTMFNPESDKLHHGWNIIQSKTAIGSGGFSGKGWLEGTQSHLQFLPESHTDFIIAVLSEEFGLQGVLGILLLYGCLIARGLFISWNAQDTFNRLLAGSLILTFFVYVFVNMAMVSGLLPVVGVPLPLVSKGGTSLVTLMAAFGVLSAIATETKRFNY